MKLTDITNIKDIDSYLETHFQISEAITIEWLKDKPKGLVAERQQKSGYSGRYELAKELTDKFEKLHENTKWGIEIFYFVALDNFIENELK
jgi:hypothetical protein